MLVHVKQEGKGTVKHKSPLSQEDIRKLYGSFDLESPKGLQDKVFVDLMLYFCNRGRENLRELKKTDFIVNENFIQMKDRATKNHKGDLNDTEEDSQGGRIYPTNNVLCPFASFVKYLSVLNPLCDDFFQRPKPKHKIEAVWYDNVSVGCHTLGDKMKRLSVEAGLSKVYTNHCLRATTITLLDIFEARHVMAISGHKSESSIRSYARTGDGQRQKMAMRIAESVSDAIPISNRPNKQQHTAVPIVKTYNTVQSTSASVSAVDPRADQPSSWKKGEYPDGIPSGNCQHHTTALNDMTHNEVPVMPAGLSVVESRPGQPSINDAFGLDFGSMDFLELTASQEMTLYHDIPAMMDSDTTNEAPSNTVSTVTGQAMPTVQTGVTKMFREIQKRSTGAPVYLFQNSTVHSHHH